MDTSMDTRSSMKLRLLTESEIELISGGGSPTITAAGRLLNGVEYFSVACPFGQGMAGVVGGNQQTVVPNGVYQSFTCANGNSGVIQAYATDQGNWQV